MVDQKNRPMGKPAGEKTSKTYAEVKEWRIEGGRHNRNTLTGGYALGLEEIGTRRHVSRTASSERWGTLRSTARYHIKEGPSA